MNNFHIGQEVVCIKTHSMGLVKKDEKYFILNTLTCNCGGARVDVGVRVFPGTICSQCGCLSNDGVVWFTTELFAPIERTRTKYVAVAETIRTMEVCNQ